MEGMLGISEAHICGGIMPQVPLRSTRGCVCYASPTQSDAIIGPGCSTKQPYNPLWVS